MDLAGGRCSDTLQVKNSKSKESQYFPLNTNLMSILRAIALGMMIIILGLLMPDVFEAFEKTLLHFFGLLDTVFVQSASSYGEGQFIPASVNLPTVPMRF